MINDLIEDETHGRITSQTDGHVRLIGIYRQAKYKGFTHKMLRELAQAYTDF